MRLPWSRAVESQEPEAPSQGVRSEAWAAADRAWAQCDLELARVSESALSQLQQELKDEAQWKRLGQSFGTSYDLNASARKTIIGQCVKLWMIDGGIAQAESLLASGTFGQGLAAPRAVDPRVQKVIDRFWSDPDNQLVCTSVQAMHFSNRALMLEGERFFTIHTSPADSSVKMADLPVEEIVEVIPHPENRRKPLLYKRVWRPSRYNFAKGRWETAEREQVRYYRDLRAPDPLLPGEDDDPEALELIQSCPDLEPDVAILHFYSNSFGLRGLPEVYRAHDWAKVHSGTVADMATVTKALAAFAWQKKVRTRSSAVVRNSAETFQSPAPGPGAVQVGNENVDLEPIKVGTGAVSNQQSTSRAAFLQAIRPFGFGEHWYGDASTGNLAIGEAMEVPAIWKITGRQTLFEQGLFRPVIDFAIERAVRLQDLGYYLPKTVERYYDLNYPPAKQKSEEQLARLLGALSEAGRDGLVEREEASYQAYVALGTDDIDEVMKRQFGQEEQLEADDKRASAEEKAERSGGDSEDEEPASEVSIIGAELWSVRGREAAMSVVPGWLRQVAREVEAMDEVPERGALPAWVLVNAHPLARSVLGGRVHEALWDAAHDVGGRIAESVGAPAGEFALSDRELVEELEKAARIGARSAGDALISRVSEYLEVALCDRGADPSQVAAALRAALVERCVSDVVREAGWPGGVFLDVLAQRACELSGVPDVEHIGVVDQDRLVRLRESGAELRPWLGGSAEEGG